MDKEDVVQAFPGGSVVKNPPVNTADTSSSGKESCEDRRHEFDPWSGKIPHALERLNPCATTTEPVL